ncbi:hypothetical protein EV426DRAFT_700473 [Tirmania nivea]|nr:hypothetical protein EV426DRAFT_700473 [Tirmania nivea]
MAHLRLEGPVEPFRLANGNPYYELGQVYESIRVQLHAIPSVPFLNQQDLQDFVASPEEYIPERQTNLTIEEIAAAYTAPSDLPDDTNLQNSSNPLDDSEPRPLITRTEVNHALEVLQLYVIQTAPSTAALPETSALIESITTLTNRMADLNMKRKQQSHLEKWLRSD